MKSFIVAIALWSAVLSLNGQTETQRVSTIKLETLTNIFLTVEAFRSQEIRGVMDARMDPEKLSRALQSNESKPEAEDHDGNWGQASEGFRLSLRFHKAEYGQDEVILAEVLLRNISKSELIYFWDGTDWFLPFTIIDGQNRKLENVRPAEPNPLGAKPRPVYPRTQRRFTIRLDSHFDFKASGTYSVTVKTRVPRFEGPRESEITSGTAHIKILSAAPGRPTNGPPSK
jgi:hypothetical protein